MSNLLKLTLGFAVTTTFAIGCQSESEPVTSAPTTTPVQENAVEGHGDSDIEVALAELGPDDRKEAEAQKFCAVQDGSLLGSMGKPVKLDINGESVFVCCSGCKSAALKQPDETLATVAKLKSENNSDK